MNNIQKLINEMEDDLLKAEERFSYFNEDGDTPYWAGMEKGAVKAFKKYIPKLKLLLNTGNENSGEKDGQIAAMQ